MFHTGWTWFSILIRLSFKNHKNYDATMIFGLNETFIKLKPTTLMSTSPINCLKINVCVSPILNLQWNSSKLQSLKMQSKFTVKFKYSQLKKPHQSLHRLNETQTKKQFSSSLFFTTDNEAVRHRWINQFFLVLQYTKHFYFIFLLSWSV